MIGCLNIWSLENKVPDLLNYLKKENDILIFGINETKLKDKISNNTLQIPNFQFIRKDKKHDGHTGIGVYINHSIQNHVKRRKDLEIEQIENIWLELRLPKEQPLLIGFIYRHPNSTNSWFKYFEQMMDKVNSFNLNTILLGDFNINMLKENKQWNSITQVLGLTQFITTPTRYENHKGSILDHIYCNNNNLITKVNVSDVHISDHQPITCSLSLQLPKNHKRGHKFVMFRNFKRFSSYDFLDDLQKVDFSQILTCTNPDRAADLFLKLLLGVVNKHAPLKKRRVKHEAIPGWLTEEVKQAMKTRDDIKKQYGKCDAYKKQRNKVTELIRKSKKAYYNKIASDINSNISEIWKAINSFTNKKRKSQTNQTIPFSVNELNEHFISITTDISIEETQQLKTYEPSSALINYCNEKLSETDSFVIPFLSVHDVEKLILKLKNKRTMDIYYLNAFLLKLSIPYITVPLTYIYNLSIHNQVFPASFKTAKVIPIPKNKDTNKIDNLRPISIIPIISKPLEKHIHNCLNKYLENKSLLHPFQSGFRPLHSCHTALINICDKWLNALNNQNIVGTVFLDLKKAFDLVNHNILYRKLQCYFKNIETCNFFKSYLTQRMQSVYVNGNFSNLNNTLSGVPQGSILGPLLFSLHINDLPLHISDEKVLLEMFADDTTLHSENENISKIQNSLQNSLDEVNQWTIDNKMSINPKKSKSMIISTKQKRIKNHYKINLNISNQNIEQTNEHKLLGVIIDENLQWSSHTEYLRKKLAKNIHLLYKLQPIISYNALKIFFFSHCMTHINYASTIWCYTKKVFIKPIQSLHKRAIKIMYKISPKKNKDRYKSLDILPLSQQFNFNTASLMYKILNDQAPTYLKNKFNISKSKRTKGCILPYIRIEQFKSSLTYQGSIIWNHLPSIFKTNLSLHTFKNKLKLHLMESDP